MSHRPSPSTYSALSLCRRTFRALILLSFLASGHSESRTPSPHPGLPDLIPVPQPDLQMMEPAVRNQLLEAQTRVQEGLAEAALHPEVPGPLFGKQGRLYLAYGLEQAALACFANACLLDSSDYRWAYYLGHLHRKAGEPEESRLHYERALALNPDYLPAYIGLAELHIEANRLDEAEQLLNRVRIMDAACAPALIDLGKIASKRGQHARAVEHFEAALRLAPDATEIHFPLGMAYRALGDREKARSFLTRRGTGKARLRDPLLQDLADLTTGSRAFNQRGDYAIIQRRFQLALGYYRQAIDADPANPEYRIDLAATLIHLEDLDGAVEQLQEGLRLAPDNAAAHYDMAIILSRQGRDEEAIVHHQKTLAIDPGHKESRLNLASALLRLRRFDEAVAQFEQVVRVDPLNGGARFGQAVALMRLERWNEAATLLEEGVTALPDDVYLGNIFARLLASCPEDGLRDGQRACAIARKLVAADRSLHNVEALAMALAELGRFEEAARLQEEGLVAVRRAGQRDQEAHLAANLERYRRQQPARSPLGD